MIVLIDHRKVAQNVGDCIEQKLLPDDLGRCGFLGLNSRPGLLER